MICMSSVLIWYTRAKARHKSCDFRLLLDADTTKRRKSHGVSAPKTIRSSFVDFTNATVVGPIRKSNRSNCRRMV